ncbi:Sterile alpha motif domain and Ankyrin repeat and Sterile alpha motif, type 2 domain and Sterile alpha motif/pointed domain and Ankyrin repeat-containing domain-containing protein [Strongyloides ratti]|uniref:NAD(+) ADP-ribosyltransferase n=1 Tax=Strongyloides ratti TaxID=34506 RepID=A0A090L4N7_STRRB|nr:Sterile alpha motif domain and Ankyrin repeat and Sterile alpha motif, type 2 domain and Sterile alpha motif/pointed domain and Ankyrin repeat-containing domain-containing protein [Strongyloides ratti]CEF62469.1 Sterile alpha motif domain and Ankyrin repeat and Sterile alpha motif, type 2 domain and Sterile alpha motif/pointed domain and Ankyrin repeat-containing domain-containing protein [Strongyloides ratti]
MDKLSVDEADTKITNENTIQILELPLPELKIDDSYIIDIFTAASVDYYTFRDLVSKIKFNEKEICSMVNFLNQKNNGGWSPLLYASYLNQIDTINLLLKYNVDCNIVNNKKETAIMLASACGHDNIVKMLIDNKGDCNLQNEHGRTALVYATLHNQISCIYVLLEKGADPNVVDDTGNTPTLYACKCDNENILRVMLQYGGNPYSVNKAGESCENLVDGNDVMLELINDAKKERDTDTNGTFKYTKKSYVKPPYANPKGRTMEKPKDILEMLKLSHYIQNFVKYDINLKMFFHLTEVDLIHIGIDNQIARNKISGIIMSFPTQRILACDPKASLKYRAQFGKVRTHSNEQKTLIEKQIKVTVNDCEEAEADISGLKHDIHKLSLIENSTIARHKSISRCVFSIYKQLNTINSSKYSKKVEKSKEIMNNFLRKYNALITNRGTPIGETKKW